MLLLRQHRGGKRGIFRDLRDYYSVGVRDQMEGDNSCRPVIQLEQ